MDLQHLRVQGVHQVPRRQAMSGSIFHNGHGERLKGGVHVVLGVTALVCFGYNVIAFALRREKHLAANSLLYGALAALEARKVRHHRDAR